MFGTPVAFPCFLVYGEHDYNYKVSRIVSSYLAMAEVTLILLKIGHFGANNIIIN